LSYDDELKSERIINESWVIWPAIVEIPINYWFVRCRWRWIFLVKLVSANFVESCILFAVPPRDSLLLRFALYLKLVDLLSFQVKWEHKRTKEKGPELKTFSFYSIFISESQKLSTTNKLMTVFFTSVQIRAILLN
jgi:hypothetical protein